jgi:outer membrane biosynthesis protein TonB
MRWTLFLLVSLAVHAAFLFPSARHGASRIELDTPFGGGRLDVALFPPAAPAAAPSAVEAEWTPLPALPRYKPQGGRRTRLLEFAPVDVATSAIDESAYLPISRVTLRPSPFAPILVPFPTVAGAEPAASRTAKVVVFIDEDGSVAKVMLAKDQSPSPFALAALKTFEHARYRPALLNETPVKVRVVIAVTFEDREAKR